MLNSLLFLLQIFYFFFVYLNRVNKENYLVPLFLLLQMFQVHEHHLKDAVCSTRPPYRDGKKPRAVKVYTIAQESKYLLVQNVPAIAGVLEQLLPYFNQHGPVEQYWKLEANEEFVETVLIKFVQIHQARLAKCKLDDLNFMGSILHVCYAPECETVDDLREKLAERRTSVQRRNNLNRVKKPSRKAGAKQPVGPTTDEIRAKMRDIVQNSNLISLVLQQEIKRKKRLQI